MKWILIVTVVALFSGCAGRIVDSEVGSCGGGVGVEIQAVYPEEHQQTEKAFDQFELQWNIKGENANVSTARFPSDGCLQLLELQYETEYRGSVHEVDEDLNQGAWIGGGSFERGGPHQEWVLAFAIA